MKRWVFIYGAAVSGLVLLLEWLDFQHAVRMLPTEVYVTLVAVIFVGVGLWMGRSLFGRRTIPFEPNAKAMAYLGITDREMEVLQLLAKGQSNREIGESLFVSGNTVKTHLASLYGKLDVSRRTQAVDKARQLRLIP